MNKKLFNLTELLNPYKITSYNTITVGHLSNITTFGRNRLYRFFRKHGLLFSNNVPTELAIKKGYFREPTREELSLLYFKPSITHKGIRWLGEILLKGNSYDELYYLISFQLRGSNNYK